MRGLHTTGRAALIFTAAVLCAVSAGAQEAQPDPAQAKARVQSCDTYKFETSAEVEVNGKKRRMNVKMCGVEAQNDADWVRTLRDAVEKVEANDRFPAEAKEQITAALEAEIAKYAPAAPDLLKIEPVSVGQTAIVPPAAPVRTGVAPPVEYSALPPLPAPLPAKPAVTPGKAAVTRASLPPKPRLTFRCFTPGDLGDGGPCLTIDRGTIIIVEADEALKAGHSLRFLRRGEARGEVALAQTRAGRSLRVGVPQELCRGVAGSRIEVQVLATGTVVDTLGPYDLRC